jgi:hypothetical protein
MGTKLEQEFYYDKDLKDKEQDEAEVDGFRKTVTQMRD